MTVPKDLDSRWRALAEKALRGKPLASIAHTTPEGIELNPIYWDTGGANAKTGATPGWDVRAALQHGGEAEAREALADGADSIWVPAGAIVGDLGALVAEGVVVDRDDLDEADVAVASGLQAHADGADDATELAVVCEQAKQRGSSLVRVAVGCDLFAAIAKIRAIRLLLPNAGVHAVQSRRWLAERDVPTNMIRSTAAVFAASVGGADAITTLPWDGALGASSRLARRVAVTMHAVAAREAQIGAVADPAAGSYLVERWTRALVDEVMERISLPTKRSFDDDRGPQIGVTMFLDSQESPPSTQVSEPTGSAS